MDKKAQGLSLHFIVIAVIAALVLVLVIAFTIGGFGTFFGKIFGGGQAAVGEEIDVVRTTCAGLCDSAKASTTEASWKASTYCNRKFDIDLNNDGILNESEGELNIPCWNESIGVKCSTTISGKTISEQNCPDYAPIE